MESRAADGVDIRVGDRVVMHIALPCGKCRLHQGETVPEYCPICGAPAAEFALYEEPALPSAQPAVDQWRCIICASRHDGTRAPANCPLCGAHQFEPVRESAAAAPLSTEAGRREC